VTLETEPVGSEIDEAKRRCFVCFLVVGEGAKGLDFDTKEQMSSLGGSSFEKVFNLSPLSVSGVEKLPM
jgi:hypothetical protein